MQKFRMPRLSIAIGLVALVCFTGFDFIESLPRHSQGIVGYGIIFIHAVSLASISPFILFRNN